MEKVKAWFKDAWGWIVGVAVGAGVLLMAVLGFRGRRARSITREERVALEEIGRLDGERKRVLEQADSNDEALELLNERRLAIKKELVSVEAEVEDMSASDIEAEFRRLYRGVR